MRSLAISGAAALFLVGCAPQDKMMWVRTDGQSGKDNPALQQQYQIDKTICAGETQKANMSGVTVVPQGIIPQAIAQAQRDDAATDVAKGCMAQHGYMLVPEKQADAYAAQARAIAAAKQTPGAKTASQ